MHTFADKLARNQLALAVFNEKMQEFLMVFYYFCSLYNLKVI